MSKESYRPKTGFPAISNSREVTTASGPHEATTRDALRVALRDEEESSNPAGSEGPRNSACEPLFITSQFKLLTTCISCRHTL